MTTRVEAFLVGMLVAMFLTAAVFFLRFWRDTRDVLFAAFAASFSIEALTRIPTVFIPRPGEGQPWIFWLRFLGSLLILAAILNKNAAKRR